MESDTKSPSQIEELSARIVSQEEAISLLERTVTEQSEAIAILDAKLKYYEEQYLLSQKKRFGTSSETSDTLQLSLFNEAEDTAVPQQPEPTLETICLSYSKRDMKRRALSLKTA
jgi:uncharacterized coiled-coil protein SlyX